MGSRRQRGAVVMQMNYVTHNNFMTKWLRNRCPFVECAVVFVASHLSGIWNLSSAVCYAGHAGRVSCGSYYPEEAPALLCFSGVPHAPLPLAWEVGSTAKIPG